MAKTYTKTRVKATEALLLIPKADRILAKDRREILPRLSKLTVKKIRVAIDVSHPYATLIKRGLKIPHPRHWMRLAGLAGVSGELPSAQFKTLTSNRVKKLRVELISEDAKAVREATWALSSGST